MEGGGARGGIEGERGGGEERRRKNGGVGEEK